MGGEGGGGLGGFYGEGLFVGLFFLVWKERCLNPLVLGLSEWLQIVQHSEESSASSKAYAGTLAILVRV